MSEIDGLQTAPGEFEDNVMEYGYCLTPMVLMDDDSISSGAKVTYGVVSYYIYRYHVVPSQKAIGERLRTDERTIRKHMAELSASGYIKSERVGLGMPNKITMLSLQNHPDRRRVETPSSAGQKNPNSEGKPVRSSYNNKDSEEKEKRTPPASDDAEGANALSLFPEEKQKPKSSQKKAERDALLLAKKEAILEILTDPMDVSLVEEFIHNCRAEKASGEITLPREVNEVTSLVSYREQLLAADPVNGGTRWKYGMSQANSREIPNLNYVKRCAERWDANKQVGFKQAAPAAPVLPANFDDLPLADRLKAQYIAENGTEPTLDDATPFDSEPWWRWRDNLRKFQQANGADLPAEMGRHTGMRPSEVREKHGNFEADLLIESGW